jgi:TonB family protein
MKILKLKHDRNRDPLHIPGAYSLAGATHLPITGEVHPLRQEGPKWISWGSTAALIFGLALFGIWQWYTHREPEVPAYREVKVMRYSDLGVPPSISRPTTPQVNVAQEMAVATPPAIAVPEPVPDEMASRTTIATQQEITQALAPITAQDMGDISSDNIIMDHRPGENEQKQNQDFQAVDQLPVRLRCDPPEYPAIARSAMVEGTVMLHVLVGKDGRVRQVRVDQGPDMLREAAVACAKTAFFNPAIFNGKPVEVWVAFPVTFHLKAGR